ncbi:hypothetical protein [Pelagicoccus albus]|uniref:Uncharacterized protein n=1 Tax=Pelagicoccus albus TaxID=415222 RepID=A0A7X1BBT7_9BACT|nr:hypothetical protein [Pelagicoccus albus]MBC2608158.1 hypothetical protein [Pelagicoccus albus]
MSSEDRSILTLDSRSENMIRRLISIPFFLRLRRQRRMLLGSSGCLVKATDWES